MFSLFSRKRTYFPLFIISILAFIFLLISATIRPYGFFIDELYFISCANRPAFGYIDQPPLSILILTGITSLFGDNMPAIRLVPALCLAATVFLSGMLTNRLGGGMAGMLLTALAVALMPVFLIFCSFYSMNAYEPLLLVMVMFFLVKIVQDDNPRYWLHIGILAGIALMMKHTFILYAIALLAGLLISGKRKLLFSKWILWGGLACFILVIPNLVWQFTHGFPSLELYRNSFTSKNIETGYLQIIIEQILVTNPAASLLWIAGLVALFFPSGKPFRFVGYAYLILLLVMFAGHSSRPDRIVSIYPFLIAFGATAVEKLNRLQWRRLVRGIIAILVIVVGLLMAPVFCPLLPPAQLREHISRLGFRLEIEEGKRGEPIPQWLADRIGWEEMAAGIANVYLSLPEAEQRNCVIVSDSYGPAGAMELYGEKYSLPPVFGTQNSFHAWGPPSDTVKTYIGVDIDVQGAHELFESVEAVDTIYCLDCTRPQREVPVYVMRNPVASVEKMWPEFKNYH